MRSFLKFFIRSFFLLILLVIFFTLAINFYLGFSGTKERIVLQAQEALGKPLQVGWIYFLPWSGLHIQNITVTDPSHSASIRASSLSFGIWDILKIGRNRETWDGEIRIKKIFFNDHLILRKISAELNKTKNAFSINPLVAKSFGGKVQGALMLQKNDQAFSLYQGSFSFFDIPLKESLSGTALQQKVSAGRVQGKINFTGVAGEPASLQGSGSIELLGAELKTGDFFGSLSHLFPMEELRLLKLHEAKANYTLSSDALHIDAARLKSENMMVTAQGNVSLSGEVSLDAQLLLKGKLAEHFIAILPPEVAAAVSQAGSCEIPFKVYGPVTNLQTNFFKEILKQQIQNNVGGILEQLLNKTLK